jgi:hypothetical protein
MLGGRPAISTIQSLPYTECLWRLLSEGQWQLKLLLERQETERLSKLAAIIFASIP